ARPAAATGGEVGLEVAVAVGAVDAAAALLRRAVVVDLRVGDVDGRRQRTQRPRDPAVGGDRLARRRREVALECVAVAPAHDLPVVRRAAPVGFTEGETPGDAHVGRAAATGDDDEDGDANQRVHGGFSSHLRTWSFWLS